MWGVCPSLSGGLAVIITAAAATFPTYEVIRKFNQTQVRDNTNHKSSNIKELRKNDKKILVKVRTIISIVNVNAF